jgi:hypothetical protein
LTGDALGKICGEMKAVERSRPARRVSMRGELRAVMALFTAVWMP